MQEEGRPICGTIEAPFLGKAKDQVGGRADDLRAAGQLRLGETGDVLPPVRGQPADGVMKAVFGVRLFHIDFNSAVAVHFGVDDLGAVVQGEKWIHHNSAPPSHFSAFMIP